MDDLDSHLKEDWLLLDKASVFALNPKARMVME